MCVLIVKWWFHRNGTKFLRFSPRNSWCEETMAFVSSIPESNLAKIEQNFHRSCANHMVWDNKGTPWIENESFVIHYLPGRISQWIIFSQQKIVFLLHQTILSVSMDEAKRRKEKVMPWNWTMAMDERVKVTDGGTIVRLEVRREKKLWRNYIINEPHELCIIEKISTASR